MLRGLLCRGLLSCAMLLSVPLSAAPVQDEVQVVRAWFDDAAALATITPLLGHAQIDRDKGLLRTEADAFLRSRLIAAGFRVEVDAEATASIQRFQRAMSGDKSIPGFSCYRTVEESHARATQLASVYPGLVSVVDIGQSWVATQGAGGYPMRVLRISNDALPGPKPLLFLIGSIHAREYTPAELVLRFAEELVTGYGSDADATWIVDHHEVQVLIQGNPDGRKRAETGLSWRKNANNAHCANGNRRGVDLNRNFPFVWGQYNGSSADPCNDTFRGPSATSEPETQSIVAHVRAIFADRRGPALTDAAPLDTSGIFMDIHSYSQLVLWPWGFIEDPAPNRTELAALGRRLAGFNNYTAEAAIGLYPTDGTTDDFAYGELGLPSYTIELGTAFFESCATFENTVLPANRDALRYAARSIRAPYVLPSGPDATQARVEPDLILAGDPVNFTVRLDDERQQTASTSASGPVPAVQPITSVRAYLGTPPWQSGAAPLLMNPVDGSFNATVENATLTLPTRSLAPGRHLVYAQGRDSSGADGPVGAAFIEVLAPGAAATLSGRVREFGTLAPLAARMSVGRYQTDTQPADGSYVRLLPAGSYALAVSAPGHETHSIPNFSIAGGDATTRDFELYRLCPLLIDAGEPGQATSLIGDAPWIRRNGAGMGASGAWLQSAAGNYGNNLNASLTSATLNLSGYTSVALAFDQRCDTEAAWDFGIVEFSTNGGGNWSEVFRCNGETSWRAVSLALPQLDGAATARLRWRFTSDTNTVRTGWAIDNLVLSAGGPTCRATQGPAVRVDSLTATPAQIASGASTSLSWTTANALACQITSSLGGTPLVLDAAERGAGSRVLSPASDVTYTLTCNGNNGPVSRLVEVDVQPPPPSVAIASFSATPTQIITGASTTLAWNTSAALSCEIGSTLGGAPIVLTPAERDTGSRVFSPASDVTYSLSCNGNNGPVQRTTSVQVSVPLPAEIFVNGFEL